MINVGGQNSNIFWKSAGAGPSAPPAVTYAAPVISAFGLTQLAQTPGGEEIEILGANFGFDISLVSVFATARPVIASSYGAGLVPGSPPGVVTLIPRNCWLVRLSVPASP